MAEWYFYHLESTGVEDALPPLVEKCLERGWRVLVSSPSPARLQAVDEALWTLVERSFIPHAREDAEGLDPQRQPVLLSAGVAARNGAQALVLLDGQAALPVAGYERCLVVFDGADQPSREMARSQYRAARDAGQTVRYFQQTPAGGWAEKG